MHWAGALGGNENAAGTTDRYADSHGRFEGGEKVEVKKEKKQKIEKKKKKKKKRDFNKNNNGNNNRASVSFSKQRKEL